MGSYSGVDGLVARAIATQQFRREALFLTGTGIKAETFPRLVATASAAMIDGTVYATGLGLLQGDVVSNISIMIFGGGASVTLSKVGIYDALGNRLALSADQGTAWQSTGVMTCAMISPSTIPADGLYYAAIVAKASVTLPTFAIMGATIPSAAIGGAAFPYASMLTQTDLPPTVTLQVASGAQRSVWCGIS